MNLLYFVQLLGVQNWIYELAKSCLHFSAELFYRKIIVHCSSTLIKMISGLISLSRIQDKFLMDMFGQSYLCGKIDISTLLYCEIGSVLVSQEALAYLCPSPRTVLPVGLHLSLDMKKFPSDELSVVQVPRYSKVHTSWPSSGYILYVAWYKPTILIIVRGLALHEA